MEPEEKLQRESAIARSLKQTSLRTGSIDSNATIIGYNAATGQNVIRLANGSITYASSDTNGVIAIGETVPLNSDSMAIDGLPNIKRQIIPSKKAIPKTTGNIKILLATKTRLNDIQEEFSYYITGDRFSTRKIAQLVCDSFAPVQIFSGTTDYPYSGGSRPSFYNLGKGKNDFLFYSQASSRVYPYFNDGTGGIAPRPPGGAFFVLNNEEDPPFLSVSTSTELAEMLQTNDLYFLGDNSFYEIIRFVDYPSNNPDFRQQDFILINIRTKEVRKYNNNSGFTYVLPDIEWVISNSTIDSTEYLNQTVFINNLLTSAIIAKTRVGGQLDENKIYLIKKIDGVNEIYKLNNARELLQHRASYTWVGDRVYGIAYINLFNIASNGNKANIEVFSYLLKKTGDEINVLKETFKVKVNYSMPPDSYIESAVYSP